MNNRERMEYRKELKEIKNRIKNLEWDMEYHSEISLKQILVMLMEHLELDIVLAGRYAKIQKKQEE